MHISAADSGSGLFGGSAADRAELTRNDFMKILTAELAYQDPFEPLDNKEFLGQLTQLQTLEATSTLTDSIQFLIRAQEMATGSQFLGRTVTGLTDDDNIITGRATKVMLKDGAVRLLVDGKAIALGHVTEVTE